MYTKTVEESLKEVCSTEDGLKSSEAKKRLEQNGENVLPPKKQKSKIARFFSQFADIMIIILLVAAAISIAMAIIQKDMENMIDGIIILAIVILNAIIGYVQEIKAEQEMKALLSMSEPYCKVMRDGEVKKVLSKDIVVGDIVVLEAGDIVPADLRLVSSANIKCDESSLTGESLAVEKDHNFVCKENTPLGDRKNMAYKGSVVTIGRAHGVCVATGKDTELGKIATMLSEADKSLTPLQKSIKMVGKVITIIVLIIAALTFGLELLLKPNGSVIEAFLTAVAISVAAIPESLPAVITIIMSIGVGRLSKKKAIVKRLQAVETLGSTEIICSDKTGTLTQNVMTVRKVYYNGDVQETHSVEDIVFFTLLKTMTLCNDSAYSQKGYVGDPTETALVDFSDIYGLKKVQAEADNIRVAEIPFDSNRKMMTTLNEQEGKFVSYTKGGTDEILKHCTKILINGSVQELTSQDKKSIVAANKEMAKNALRVLAFAVKNVDYNNGQKLEEDDLTFVGLVGMIDPPRKEAVSAVKKCKKAHMTPIMITGDHAITALAIAKEIGICENEDEVLTGAELDELSDEEYLKIINKIKVYARVSPENKVRIVKTFKSLGKIVAMTGDGVNDAPSLKTADIGVGMGITGTDVTKEVADMIVTDDNFATIIVAVGEGRRIYSNIKKTIGFLFAANFAEIFSLLLATIIYPALRFLLPVQILFVNLITDSLPAIALGMELPEKDIMNKPPRKSNQTIFANGMGIQMLIMGIVQTACVLTAFSIGNMFNEDIATSMAFYTLNLVQLVYMLSIRTSYFAFGKDMFKNKWIWLALGVGLVILAIFAFTPVGTIIGLKVVSGMEWLIILGLTAGMFVISEICKVVLRQVYRDK